MHSFWTWSVQLFLPGPRQFLLGPCPRGPHPGDEADEAQNCEMSIAFYNLLEETSDVLDSVADAA